MFSIRLEGGTPIYEQLTKRISELVINGTLRKDEKMPTVREVAKELGINPNTVQKAYQLLEQQGFIYSIQGKGSYVASLDKNLNEIKKKALLKFIYETELAMKQGLTKPELITAIENFQERTVII